MARTDGWREVDIGGQAQLERTFRFADFAAAMEFANALAEAAEAANHHPQMVIEWGRVTVRWYSHDAAAITERDERMALATNALAERQRGA